MTEEEEIEQLLAQSPAPRVTIDSMTARIADVTYTRLPGGTMTICQITIDNGFVVIGESACVNPENYNQTIGEQIAYNNAYNKLWPLFGFLLAETLYQKGITQGNG
jgi:hypothetical protein